MKYLFSILLLTLFSCKNKNNSSSKASGTHTCSGQELEEIASKRMINFNHYLTKLYSESEHYPDKVIEKADSCICTIKTGSNKSHIVEDQIKSLLNHLKAELYYKKGDYNQSIKTLDTQEFRFIYGHDALAIAANYTKLKQFDKSKIYIDKIAKGFYIYNYALGNYYETIGDKNNALKIYKDIKLHREFGHYKYYKLTLKRIKELESPNPKLLTELYFPTGDPAYDVIDDNDNELRVKIFKLLDTIPECKGLERHIFRSPKTNNKDYYWIKVGKNITVSHDYAPDYKAQYDFFVYAKDLSVKYYNPETKKLLSLKEWRRKSK